MKNGGERREGALETEGTCAKVRNGEFENCKSSALFDRDLFQ